MDKIKEKFKIIRKFCQENANPKRAEKYSRYFTEGYDAYGLSRDTLTSQRDKWLKTWENEFTFQDYISLGDKLISTGKYEEASLAIVFIAEQKKKLTAKNFERIGNWLEKGIVNWGHTDILCGYVLSYFLIKKIVKIDSFKNWINSPSKWKRRAVPVTFIDALETDIPVSQMLMIIEPLMEDEDKFVQKGLGWFLREVWKRFPRKAEDFLLKWKNTCGRIIIQYATEKMDKASKIKFKKDKK